MWTLIHSLKILVPFVHEFSISVIAISSLPSFVDAMVIRTKYLISLLLSISSLSTISHRTDQLSVQETHCNNRKHWARRLRSQLISCWLYIIQSASVNKNNRYCYLLSYSKTTWQACEGKARGCVTNYGLWRAEIRCGAFSECTVIDVAGQWDTNTVVDTDLILNFPTSGGISSHYVLLWEVPRIISHSHLSDALLSSVCIRMRCVCVTFLGDLWSGCNVICCMWKYYSKRFTLMLGSGDNPRLYHSQSAVRTNNSSEVYNNLQCMRIITAKMLHCKEFMN